jgi:four helix bundle protein
MEDKLPKGGIQERSFKLALETIKLAKQLDSQSWISRTVGKQLLRAGTSVGANVEEGQAGQSRADFINKYKIALKEARETIYWLRLINESGEGAPATQTILRLKREAEEISLILGAIVVKAAKNSEKT